MPSSTTGSATRRMFARLSSCWEHSTIPVQPSCDLPPATGTATAWFFFLIDDDRNLVEAIQRRFPREQCLQFKGTSLMNLLGHDWRPAGHT